MIRVLHIVSSLGTGSGVMSVLMSYHRNLDRVKFQFDYLCFRETEQTFEQEIGDLGGRVYHFPSPKPGRAFQSQAEAFFRQHREYEIVHCHPIYGAFFFGKAARKQGVPHVIQHSHTTRYSDKPISALRNWALLSLFPRRATDFTACSAEARAIFWWKKPEKVFIMENALDTEKFTFSDARRAQIRDQYGIGEKTLVLGHIGRFSPEKNHMFLLSILKKVPEAVLLLVGDGPRMEQVKEASRHRGLEDRVIFAGRQRDVAGYLSAMDVFFLPSTFEGLGIVLLEAQCNGLPCLASSRVPPETDVSGNVCYLPLEDGTAPWAEALPGLHRASADERLDRYRIGPAARTLEAYYEGLN